MLAIFVYVLSSICLLGLISNPGRKEVDIFLGFIILIFWLSSLLGIISLIIE